MSTGSISVSAPRAVRLGGRSLVAGMRARPELAGLLGVAALLNLWGLSINGWANQYYSAAVRSMTTSWHDFLFASLDKSGLMTVDKPPLSLWIQALSARVFGFHPLSLLVPQALMGMVAAGLVYDLVRRPFGRVSGFAAGLALATTPIAVAVSRHNNPDELLALCSVAALWFAVRAFETRRTRWLLLSGVAIGFGFETKMGVALMVVPGIAAAWMWISSPGWRARFRAFRQLLAGGLALVIVGGAWPLLVTLAPAADRPWISGTSDNSIWSLMFGYNGLGRLAGQTGGPAAAPGGGPGGAGGPGGTLFGGPTGPFRLLQSGLGDQAGWLLGFAIVAGIGLLVTSRLRRGDTRTPWLIAVGGAFLTTMVAFSFASGIFHPYYVSLLAPFVAALVGAGVGQMLDGGRSARIIGPLALAGGAITELVVLGGLNRSLSWAVPVVIAVGGGSAVILAFELSRRARLAVASAAVGALMLAPATWAAETLGHATNGTFPTGGSASASIGRGGRPGFGGGRAGGRLGAGFTAPPGGGPAGVPPGGGPGSGSGFAPSGSAGPGGFAGAGGPGGFGSGSFQLSAAVRYAKAHGGGTIAVSSQGTAAPLIVSSNANVAGIGGFSGRESSVSAAWIATEVKAGHLRWVMPNSGQDRRLPGDTRTGSQSAVSIIEKTCRKVTSTSAAQTVTMYDCLGRASAIMSAAGVK